MEQVDAAQYNNKNDHNKKGRPTSKNNLEKQLSKIFFLSLSVMCFHCLSTLTLRVTKFKNSKTERAQVKYSSLFLFGMFSISKERHKSIIIRLAEWRDRAIPSEEICLKCSTCRGVSTDVQNANTQVRYETAFKGPVSHQLALLRTHMFKDASSKGL